MSGGQDTVWFNWVDGYNKNEDPLDETEKFLFDIHRPSEAADCHRAHFLNGCVELLPAEFTRFRKTLRQVVDQGARGLSLEFSDGSRETADAVIGCDGINSRVRQLILGEDNPQCVPQYSHYYAYRGLIPMERVVQELGDTFRGRYVHVRSHVRQARLTTLTEITDGSGCSYADLPGSRRAYFECRSLRVSI